MNRSIVGWLCCLLMAVVAMAGCTDIFVGGDTTQNNNIFSPGASGDEEEEPAADIASVLVTKISESCPSGLVGTGERGKARVGCQAVLTCTPKLADGTDAPPEVHGPTPDSFAVVGGFNLVLFTGTENPFNRLVQVQGAGTAGFQCTVKGRASEIYSLLLVPPGE